MNITSGTQRTITYNTNNTILLQDEDRKSLLRSLSEEQYKDVIRVLAMVPILDIEITTEVVDDEEQHVVTAGAIITVTVVLNRR